MSSQLPNPSAGKATSTDTKRDAPRRMMVFIVALALLAVIVLLLGIYYTGGTK